MPFFGGLFGKKGKQQSTNVQYDDQISPQSTTPPPPFTPPPRRHKSPHSPLTRPSPSPNGLDGDDSSSNYPSSYPRRLERLPDNPSRSERRAAGNGLPSRPSLNVTTLHTPDRQSSGKPSPRGVQQRTTSPSLPHLASSDSLRPPPSRSAVFGGYAYSDSDDSDGLLRVTSSQSLPDAIPSHSGSPPKTPSGAITRSERGLTHQRARSSTEGSQNSFKSTRSKSKIFGWFKSSKSKSNSREGRNGGAEGSSENTSSSSQQSGSAIPPVPRTRLLASGGSLTVKGFRQVRPVSPGPSKPITTSSSHPLSTTTNLSPSRTSLDAALPPIGRPRGDSVGSESSQRVTVAAFRQAQARRSSVHMNGSPILGPAGDEPPLPNRTSFTLDADASSLMSAATSLWLGWDLGQQQQQQQQQPSSPVGPGLRLSTAGGGADNKSFVTFASNNGPRRSSFAQDDSKDGSPDHHHHHHHRSNNTSPTKNSGDNSLISNAKSSFSRSESNLGRQDTITAKNPGPLSKSAFYQKSRSQPSSPVVQSPPSPTRPMRSAARPPPSASVLLGASASAIAQPRQSSVSTVTSTGTVTVTGTGTGIKPFKASHSRGESGSTVTDRSTSHVGEQARASSSLASYGRSQGSKSTPILGASSPEGAGAGASGGRRQSGKGGKGKVTQPSSGAARRAVSMFADQSETSDEEESEADR
ncbi:uncharacterized protein EI90DRAFT_157931 [Cantharellus anzutake]|uniref:uncharacterized protein n=1 Tax=Cantharellus anzutake TaxID=1750568 RepID=UPI0019049784|nr:uncharacterized protein EI90DRAFT_157931 [Cantharellus anzutake]KAF8336308.1 hypothetical protein EI90DRAFT_157931 [Cantharellus anzutake]